MTRITLELIRKKAEHHDGLLAELEEISLHQLNIERIETLNNVCPRLRILYLQNNLIPKIENMRRMKDLQYLNLAMNNLTRIEGLQSCEKLQKLDLTLNFIALSALAPSMDELKHNEFLTELYMKGNPCDKWTGYRYFVVASLPQLKMLDGQEVTRSERLQAQAAMPKLLEELPGAIAEAEAEAERQRKESDGSEASRAWSPEERLRMYREAEEKKQQSERERQESSIFADGAPKDQWKEAQKKMNQKVKPPEDGSRPLQRNPVRFKYSFKGHDDPKADTIVWTLLDCPKYLDTSLIDVDIHTNWFQVLVKDSLILLHLDRPVHPGRSKVQRVTSTGHLILTMPVEKTSDEAGGDADGLSLAPLSLSSSDRPAAKRPPGSSSSSHLGSIQAGDLKRIVPSSDESGAPSSTTLEEVSAKRTPELERQREKEAEVAAASNSSPPASQRPVKPTAKRKAPVEVPDDIDESEVPPLE